MGKSQGGDMKCEICGKEIKISKYCKGESCRQRAKRQRAKKGNSKRKKLFFTDHKGHEHVVFATYRPDELCGLIKPTLSAYTVKRINNLVNEKNVLFTDIQGNMWEISYSLKYFNTHTLAFLQRKK